ncbi:MAG TPA: tetratricopeptide repeat protein [Enhygromyxa sp.]|nr:tetratricopeptide repeat protein [Enhygromyxa sp.]
MATSLPDLNQLARSVGEADRAAQQDPQQREPLLELLLEFCQALLAQHEFADAGTASAEAMRVAGDLIEEGRPEFAVQLGIAMRYHADALLELGESERALDVYGSAIRLLGELAQGNPSVGPEWASTLLNHGEALRRCGRAEQALAVLDQALASFELASGRALTQLARGRTLAELGRAEQALAATREAVELAREHDDASLADALDALATLLRSLGRADEAVELAEQATELVARLAQRDAIRYLLPLARLTNNLARAYQQARQFDRATALFEQAVSGFRILAQARPHAHGLTLIQVMSNHSLALAQTGALERAHAVASEALELAQRESGWELLPLITGARQFLADLALDLGRPEEALEHLVAGMRLLRAAIEQQLPGTTEAATRLGASLRELCATQRLAIPEDVAAMLSSSA